MKLDKTRPYATIHGHAAASFSQDGHLFDGAGLCLDCAKEEEVTNENLVTDEVANSIAFVKHLLKDGPKGTDILHDQATRNNQNWENVKKALVEVKAIKIKLSGKEAWKLREGQ